ncbi:aromatic acid exporter family protein [Cohnella endophytica]|uniref:Aromatic acid exporter family protein n=1 Tax=Cohnella endophytica TaxID=2419778 RepID=A0A494Y8I8_9BACL|nr:aromatic acid exporter family protein [Cohnella endophytica]RKP56953.1 aromatic acid exporter family protein [Cohnella endophytica]
MGIRVIKTAVATLVAIYAAYLLGVDNPLSAGILAIMGVDTTRWRGLKTVFARFMASVLGLLLASLLFGFVGFYIWVLAVYILLAYPLLARTGLKDGIITGSVIVFHLFARNEVTAHALLTELELLTIGLGSATLFNMAYMPKESRTLAALRVRTEEGFSAIFGHLAEHLRKPDSIWGGEEMLETLSTIEQGIEVSQRARENRLIPQDEPWMLYFQMRRQQMESIELMMESVAFVSSHVSQAELIAVLFDRLKEDVKSDFYEGETERMLGELEAEFKGMPLPFTRDEFETRSALFHLTRELRRYLGIASREKKRKSTSAQAIIQ